jgi:micrococcal nuclease
VARSIRRRGPAVALATTAVVLLVAIRAAYDVYVRDDAAPLDEPLPEGWYDVDRVVDGDTIRVFYTPANVAGTEQARRKSIRVRLIGVDAPEVARGDEPAEPYAAEATEFTRGFLSGNRVCLQFGPRRLDQYHRVLAYVFVDGAMLNEEIVRQGLAREDHFTGDNLSIARRIRKAQLEAKQAKRGLWSGISG